MRQNTLALGALAVLAALTVVSQADALQAQKTFKEVVLTIRVTPSPAPIVFFRRTQPARPANVHAQLARLVESPYAGPARVASSNSLWDVAPGAPVMIAQSSAQPTPVPVQFVAKADPNAAFLRIIPHPPASGEYDVPYGTTVFTCAFEVFTYYTNYYKLIDWGYGTNKTTGANAGVFPIENYPVTSYLSWAVPDFSATYVPYNNAGPPGETVWLGAVGQAQQHCVNLTILVPNSQSAGLFTATIQYNLYVTLP